MYNLIIILIILSCELVTFKLFLRTIPANRFAKIVIYSHFTLVGISVILLFKDMFYARLGDYRDFYWLAKSLTVGSFFISLFVAARHGAKIMKPILQVISILGILFSVLVGIVNYIIRPETGGGIYIIENYRIASFIDGLDHFNAGERIIKLNSLGMMVKYTGAGEMYDGICDHDYSYSKVYEANDTVVFQTTEDTCRFVILPYQWKLYLPPQ